MNLSTQICGDFLLVLLGIFYFRQKSLHLLTEKMFRFIYCTTFISLLLDQISIVALYYKEVLPEWLVNGVCKGYLCSLVLLGFCAMLYIATDFYYCKKRWFKHIVGSFGLIFAIGMVLIALLPIYAKVDKHTRVIYTYGSSVMVTYVIAVLFVLSGVFFIIRRRKRMNPNRQMAFLCWTGIWSIAAIIQFIRNDWLLIGYACSLGVMLMYLKLENPQFNIERETGCYNQEAFRSIIMERYTKKQPFSFLLLSYAPETMRYFMTESGSKIKWEAINYLNSIQDVMTFRYSEEEIILFFKDCRQAEEISENLLSHMKHDWKNENRFRIQMQWILFSDCQLLEGTEELYHFLRYVENYHWKTTDNRLLIADEKMIYEMHQERQMENLIEWVIEKEQVVPYYQPIYSNQEKVFVSAEALMRIKDQDGRLIPPYRFIPVAEKTGKIKELGRLIFKRVCEFVVDNQLEQLGIHYVEVNLSVIQCMDENLAEDFIAIMEHYHINPTSINFEITETAALIDKTNLLQNMKRLIEYGVTFSLDDFGTGQSNLNYIVDMPVEIVKFDKGMIDSYFSSERAKYVMDAAMHMIHGMKLKIVAEGIETKEQFEEMEKLGINYIQGYYFSKPVPGENFLGMLQLENS